MGDYATRAREVRSHPFDCVRLFSAKLAEETRIASARWMSPAAQPHMLPETHPADPRSCAPPLGRERRAERIL